MDWASMIAQLVNNPPAMQKTPDSSSIPGVGRSTAEGIGYPLQYSWTSQVVLVVKNLAGNAGDVRDAGLIPGSGRYRFDPWVRKIPWRRKWQPTPVFLPGESPRTGEPGRLQFMGS